MKTTKLFITFLIALSPFVSEAQILKKIGKKAEEAAERTILRKTDEKTSQKVGKQIDKTVDGNNKNKDKNRKQQTEKAAAFQSAYTFSYKYDMLLTSNYAEAQNMRMTFRLEPDASYMGMDMSQQGVEMFQIIDSKQETSYSFINASGNKMASSTHYGGYIDDNEEDLSGYTIKALPNKTIMGYECTGTQVENDEWSMIFYATDKAGVSIGNMFMGDGSQNIPKELEQHINPSGNYLMMYMELQDKKNSGKKDRSVKMECIAFEKQKYVFNTSGYQSF